MKKKKSKNKKKTRHKKPRQRTKKKTRAGRQTKKKARKIKVRMKRGRKKLNENKNKRELGTSSFLRLSKQTKKGRKKKKLGRWKTLQRGLRRQGVKRKEKKCNGKVQKVNEHGEQERGKRNTTDDRRVRMKLTKQNLSKKQNTKRQKKFTQTEEDNYAKGGILYYQKAQ